MYFTSPGCPPDISLQLGKACYPAGKDREGIFLAHLSYAQDEL